MKPPNLDRKKTAQEDGTKTSSCNGIFEQQNTRIGIDHGHSGRDNKTEYDDDTQRIESSCENSLTYNPGAWWCTGNQQSCQLGNVFLENILSMAKARSDM